MSDLENSAAETYSMLGKAKDATFELIDSVMTTRNQKVIQEEEDPKNTIKNSKSMTRLHGGQQMKQ